MTLPKATFLMTAHNAGSYIRESIESVLSQTYEDFVLMIIDDASEDSTAEIISSFGDRRIIYVHNKEKLGTAEAANVGLLHIETQYILRIDSDDICLPVRLALQLQFMESHPEIGVCGSYIEYFGNRNGVWKMPLDDKLIRARLLWDNVIANSSVIIRTDLLKEHEIKYDSQGRKPPIEDYGLWLALLPYAGFANIPTVLVLKREHSTSQSEIYRHGESIALKQLFKWAFNHLGMSVSDVEIELHLLGKKKTGRLSNKEQNEYTQWQGKLLRYFSSKGFIDQFTLKEVNKWKKHQLFPSLTYSLVSFLFNRRKLARLLMALLLPFILPSFTSAEPLVKKDDSFFNARLPRQSLLDSFSNNKAFHYNHSAVGQSLWDKFWQWVSNVLGNALGKIFSINGNVWYLILFLLIAFIIYLVFRSDILKIFSKPVRVIKVQDIDENVHEIDFDKLIKENIEGKQYRYAIRMYYLKALKLLDNKGLIKWETYKTNREYLSALHSSPFYNGFNELTGIFNFTWYGDFHVDENTFIAAQRQFINFHQLLVR